MNLRPVIERELICEARNEVNYWLRVIGAAALLFVGAMYVLNEGDAARWQGRNLFLQMNLAIWATAFVLVPLLVADAVAREKREGTLGLLFLTPLKAPDIVIGKCLVQALRSLTILVATVPMLCVPLMMGGVSFWQVLSAVAANLGAISIGMAAGIHASVRQVDWLSAAVHSLGISLALSLGFWFGAATALSLAPAIAGFIILPVSLFILRGFLRSASIWLAGNWRRELYRPTEPYWMSVIARSRFWRRLVSFPKTASLDRNPIAWLEEHTWTGRVTKWSWLLFILGATLLGGCIVGPFMDYPTWLNILMLALAGGVAFMAGNSFRREQQSGALELLLVTPLTARQILLGRLRGMILHFTPATVLLAFFWMVPAWFASEVTPGEWLGCWLGFSTVLTVPMIGFWFALRRLHYVTAWLLTILTGYLVPVTVIFALHLAFGPGPNGTFGQLPGLILFTVYQAVLAILCYHRVIRALETRSFVTELA